MLTTRRGLATVMLAVERGGGLYVVGGPGIASGAGAYATASGAGPVTVEWSGIRFWRK
jgi:hypothetical protein